MYFIVGYNLIDGCKEVCAETSDPAQAYELAHEWDDYLREDKEKLRIIGIEDEDGNNVWNKCCLARCPSVSGSLFQ